MDAAQPRPSLSTSRRQRKCPIANGLPHIRRLSHSNTVATGGPAFCREIPESPEPAKSPLRIERLLTRRMGRLSFRPIHAIRNWGWPPEGSIPLFGWGTSPSAATLVDKRSQAVDGAPERIGGGPLKPATPWPNLDHHTFERTNLVGAMELGVPAVPIFLQHKCRNVETAPARACLQLDLQHIPTIEHDRSRGQ